MASAEIEDLYRLAAEADELPEVAEGDGELGNLEEHVGNKLEVLGFTAVPTAVPASQMIWYPGSTRRALPQNSSQARINPTVVILHTAVSNGVSLYNFFNGNSNGVESHHYLRQDGTAEQYMAHNVRADCQRDGNAFGLSVESWDGYRAVWTHERDLPAWNTAQVRWLVDYLAWCNRRHNIPLRINTRYNEPGIAWHNKYIGSPGYAASARACPGSRRIAQIPGLVAAARAAVDGPQPDPEPEPQDSWSRLMSDLGFNTRAELDTFIQASVKKALDHDNHGAGLQRASWGVPRIQLTPTAQNSGAYPPDTTQMSPAQFLRGADHHARRLYQGSTPAQKELLRAIGDLASLIGKPMSDADRKKLADDISARVNKVRVDISVTEV